MCVGVILEPGTSLSVDEIQQMFNANADGVGIAWAHEGVVEWYKTIKPDFAYIHKMIEYWMHYPRLVHFRLSTAGGTRVDLCHPFEVGPLATCKAVHKTDKVLIHNGHWGRWDDVWNIMKGEHLLPDNGPWSDTRLGSMLGYYDEAWLTALAGFSGKVATLDGEGEIKTIGEWVELRKGIRMTNNIWQNTKYRRGGYTGYKNWKGWGWDDAGWHEWHKDQEQKARAIMAGTHGIQGGEVVDIADSLKASKKKGSKRNGSAEQSSDTKSANHDGGDEQAESVSNSGGVNEQEKENQGGDKANGASTTSRGFGVISPVATTED